MPKSSYSSISNYSSASNMSVRKLASQQVKQILNARAEKKWYPLDVSNNPTVASPSFTDLTALIVQGDQYNQRNGDQIRMYKVICNYQSVVNPSATWTGCRVLLVRSKGGAQTQGTILVPHTSAVPMYGAVNTANVDILYDRRYVVDTYGGQPAPIVSFDIRLPDELVQYPAGSTSAKRPLYLLVQSDAVSLSPSNQGYVVLKYRDI